MKKEIIDILKIILISFILEIVLFNITTYISLFRGGEKVEYKIGKNYDFIGANDETKIIIPIENINKNVNTIFLNIQENFSSEFEYEIAYSDETSSEMMWTQNKRMYIKEIEKSKYTNTYLSGNVKTIWILTDKAAVEHGEIESIIINERIPLEINFARFFATAVVLLFIYAINHVKEEYDSKDLKQEIILILFIFAVIFIITIINALTRFNYTDFYSYDFLNAIKSGQVSLERDDSANLSKLQDPYDSYERAAKLDRNTDFLWDCAYYNGNYYVYFGIVPMLTLFLPFNLITNKIMISSLAVLIYSILVVILLKEILIKVINKYFEGVSFKTVLASLAILCFGSMILFLNGIPRFYEVAIISGLYFTLQGLYFILIAIQDEEKIKYRYIFFGSLFMALAVGCRPTYLIASLIVLPLFVKLFVENIKNKNKKHIIFEVLCVGIPYMTIGIALMYYNYIRFGNILEFGAKYQLTINNMATLGSRLYTIPKGLWCNLFSLPNFTGEFPYIGNHNKISFNGYYYIENMIGGLFILAPICFLNLSIFKILKKIEKNKLRNLIIILIITGTIIAALSVFMAGSNQRYITDYAWIFISSGILIFYSIYTNLKSRDAKKILEKIIGIIAVYTIIINIAAGIVSEKNDIKRNSSQEFNKLKYMICFWEL